MSGICTCIHCAQTICEYVSHTATNIWFYDGALSVSALVVIVGMSVLFVALALYYGWKWYAWLRWRRHSEDKAEEEEKPLLGGGGHGRVEVSAKFIAL